MPVYAETPTLEECIEKYRPLVYRIMNKTGAKPGLRDDLWSEALLVMERCRQRWNPNLGVKFITPLYKALKLAFWRIIQSEAEHNCKFVTQTALRMAKEELDCDKNKDNDFAKLDYRAKDPLAAVNFRLPCYFPQPDIDEEIDKGEVESAVQAILAEMPARLTFLINSHNDFCGPYSTSMIAKMTCSTPHKVKRDIYEVKETIRKKVRDNPALGKIFSLGDRKTCEIS